MRPSLAAQAYADKTGLVIGDLCDGPRQFGDETMRLRHALAVAWQNGFTCGRKDNQRMADQELTNSEDLRAFVAAVREHAESTPAGECSQDYRDGFEACANWIKHELRVLGDIA